MNSRRMGSAFYLRLGTGRDDKHLPSLRPEVVDESFVLSQSLVIIDILTCVLTAENVSFALLAVSLDSGRRVGIVIVIVVFRECLWLWS